MQIHPAAKIFPLIGVAELKALAADIKQHGQREPIILYEGKILDGRNRWKACKLAKVEPKTKQFKGSPAAALSFVWSENIVRRHLTSSQIAAAEADREQLDAKYAAKLEAERRKAQSRKGGDRSRVTKNCNSVPKSSKTKQENSTNQKQAKAAGTNRTHLANARKVRDKAPDLHEKVKAGQLTIGQATIELQRRNQQQQLEEKAEQAKQEFADQPAWDLLCMDVIDGLESVRDHRGPARLIFTDPPYNIGIDYGEHHNDSMADDGFIEWCQRWINLCVDCLADDGSLWVMINDEYAADMVYCLRKAGMTQRGWIKWYETFGVNCKRNFNRTSRHILYFVWNPDQFVFNETAVLRRSDRQEKYADQRAQPSGKIIDDVWQIPRLVGTAKERIRGVPTQIPLALVQRIVDVASEPGDLVVDPFNGSGTTGEAAIRGSRKYVGIDASDEFIAIAEKRLRGVL